MLLSHAVSIINFTKFTPGIRTVSGTYFGNSKDLISYISNVQLYKEQGIILVTLTNEDGWGITNNTPMIGTLSASYTTK